MLGHIAHVMESEIHGGGAPKGACDPLNCRLVQLFDYLHYDIDKRPPKAVSWQNYPVLRPNLSHHDGLAGDY
jgi:hypothetical protein